jgi:hypothetical protein
VRELADLVGARHRRALGEIARRDLFRRIDDALQRAGDHSAQREDGDGAEEEGDERDQRDRGAAAGGVGVRAVERHARVEAADQPPVMLHRRHGLVDRVVRADAAGDLLRGAGHVALPGLQRVLRCLDRLHGDALVARVAREELVEARERRSLFVEQHQVHEVGIAAHACQCGGDGGLIAVVQCVRDRMRGHARQRGRFLRHRVDELPVQAVGEVEVDRQRHDRQQGGHDDRNLGANRES